MPHSTLIKLKGQITCVIPTSHMGKLSHGTGEDLPRSLSGDQGEAKVSVFLATALPPAPPAGLPVNWEGAVDCRAGWGEPAGAWTVEPQPHRHRRAISSCRHRHGHELHTEDRPGNVLNHEGVKFSKFIGEVRSCKVLFPGKLRGVALGMLFNGGGRAGDQDQEDGWVSLMCY